MKSVIFLIFFVLSTYHIFAQGKDSIYLLNDYQVSNDTLTLSINAINANDIISGKFAITVSKFDLSYISSEFPVFTNDAQVAVDTTIRYSWVSPNSKPENLPDFSTLIKVKFKILSSTTTFCFVYSQVASAQVEFVSSQLQTLPSRGISGCGNFNYVIAQGFVRRDEDNNCNAQSTFKGIPEMQVRFKNGPIEYFTQSKADGSFYTFLPLATYNVSIYNNDNLWTSCNTTPIINFTSTKQVINVNETAKPNFDCPFLSVNISTPFIRLCSEQIFKINYSNNGSKDALNAYVDITLDDSLQLKSANVPYQPLTGNVFRFILGTVKALDGGQFTVITQSTCDINWLKRTLCASAHIYPDSICNANINFSKAELFITPKCDNGTIVFSVKNIGSGDLQQDLNFATVEDDVMPGFSGKINLKMNESKDFIYPANGHSLRIIFDTIPLNPFQVKASSAIEACGTLPSGGFTTGYLNNFALGDQAPYISTYCGEVKAAYDPNDKIAVLEGSGIAHIIEPNDRIPYLVRFQNTGNDTAFLVSIEDAIDPLLDLSTLQILGASHPFTWTLNADRKLTFRFQNIELPDSTTDQVNSHGYIHFSIKPIKNIPLQSVIPNKADIYFDINPPVSTNTYFHTIGRILYTAIIDHGRDKSKVTVSPNPFINDFSIDLNQSINTPYYFELLDLQGRCIQKVKGTGSKLNIQLDHELIKETYLFKIYTDEHIISSGKLIKM